MGEINEEEQINEEINEGWIITDVTLGDLAEINKNIYKNNQYGFEFSLPNTWKDYRIITDKWEGLAIADSESKIIESGPIISIRHPEWTAENQRQDIPIMIFTINQWDSLQKEEFHIGAAPVGPTKLGSNSKYVFALPARYNFSFLEGYEEVEDNLSEQPLQPIEEGR